MSKLYCLDFARDHIFIPHIRDIDGTLLLLFLTSGNTGAFNQTLGFIKYIRQM